MKNFFLNILALTTFFLLSFFYSNITMAATSTGDDLIFINDLLLKNDLLLNDLKNPVVMNIGSPSESCADLCTAQETIGVNDQVYGGLVRGQSFSADCVYTSSIDFYIGKSGTSDDECYFKMWEAVGDLPSGSPLVEISFLQSDIVGGWNRFYFDAPIETSGNYVFGLQCPDLTEANKLEPYYTTNVYANGMYVYGNSGILDNTYADGEYAFRIYGCNSLTPELPPETIATTTNNIEFITGVLTTGSSTSYFIYRIPFILFLYIAIIFGFALTIMVMFFNYYGKYTKSKNRWG